MESEYQFASVARGHQIRKLFWTPAIGEILTVIAKDGNHHDQFAVALSVPEILSCSFSACLDFLFIFDPALHQLPVNQELLHGSIDVFPMHLPQIDYGVFVLS